MIGAVKSDMAPGDQSDEAALRRKNLAELEAELMGPERQGAAEPVLVAADEMPVMIWIAGTDMRYIYVSRTWLEFRGRAFEQEIGNGWTEGLHPDDRDLCLESYVRAFGARRPFRLQFRMRRADGEYCWMDDAAKPSFNAQGEFAGFIGAIMDIADRQYSMFRPDDAAVRMVLSLTERERQVLVLIAEGSSTKEAALRLGIKYKTADSHRSRILEKLGVHETASMVRYAIRAGLIAP